MNKKDRFPFTPFPIGWYRVANSDELGLNEVKPLHYFGRDLVLCRLENGEACTFDAHCPHLGAHLGYGGKVKDGTIRCPFHGWMYDSNGKCINSLDCRDSDANVLIHKWPTEEKNGVICLYYHPEGASPDWVIPNVASNIEGVCFKHTKSWKIRTHPQELAENTVDIAHFRSVHGSGTFSGPSLNSVTTDGSMIKLHLSAEFELSKPFSWLIGKKIAGRYINQLYGVGCFLSFGELQGKYNVSTVSMIWCTPINKEYCEISLMNGFSNFFEKPFAYVLAVASKGEGIKFMEQDFPVWENKIYHSTPLLSKEESNINTLRNWSEQFYY